MVIRMAMDTVTVTLSPATVAAARRAAEQAGTSFSAYADRALRNAVVRDAMAQLAVDGYRGAGDDWYDTIERDSGSRR